MVNVNERAWELYRQIQNQRAVLRSYDEALAFCRVRQADAPATIGPVAKALWEIAERMRGDMNLDWTN
jgi:hypothetical protein